MDNATAINVSLINSSLISFSQKLNSLSQSVSALQSKLQANAFDKFKDTLDKLSLPKDMAELGKFYLESVKSLSKLGREAKGSSFSKAVGKTETVGTLKQIGRNISSSNKGKKSSGSFDEFAQEKKSLKAVTAERKLYDSTLKGSLVTKAKSIASTAQESLGLLRNAAQVKIVEIATKIATAAKKAAAIAEAAWSLAMASSSGPILLIIAGIALLCGVIRNSRVILADLISFAKNLIANFIKIFIGVIDFITGVFTGNWKRAFKGLQEIVGGIFGQIVNAVKTPINIVIDIINGMIRNINSVIQLASNIPGIGGALKGLSIPQIPKLATGGVIDRATLALVGESGKEAVMPLEHNTGWIDNLANRIALNMPQGAADGSINLTIPVYLERNGALVDTICQTIKRQTRNNNTPVFG